MSVVLGILIILAVTLPGIIVPCLIETGTQEQRNRRSGQHDA